MTIKQDGRTARLERNRAAIVRAQVEHVQETGRLATADEIAERADVSQRSVYRIFGDKATLLREATSYVYKQLADRFPFPELDGLSVLERICRVVDHLASVYEFVTPMRRVLAKSEISPDLALEERERVRARYLEKIRSGFSDLGVFAEASPVRIGAFRLITSWNAWEYLRSEGKLPAESAKKVVCHAIEAVLESSASIDERNEDGPRHRDKQEGDET